MRIASGTLLSTLLGALLGAVAFGAAVAFALPAPAAAADLAPNYYAAPVPYYAFSWAGSYIGGTAGYEWGSVDNSATHPSGFAGGVEAGWNWQNGGFVYGGETEFNVSGAKDTFAPYQFSNPWFGTVRGRAGFAFDNVLIFGTAGLGYGELTAETFGSLSESTPASAGLPASAPNSVSRRIGRRRPSGFISISPIGIFRSPAPITAWPRTWCGSVSTITSEKMQCNASVVVF